MVAPAVLAADPVARVDPSLYRVETMVAGLERPWSVAILPDGRMLITELPGRLRPAPLDGLPPIYVGGQMGLMDVAPDPDFASNSLIYLTLAYGTPSANNARLVRAKLDGDRLSDVTILFSATPKSGHSNNGSRIAFLRDKTLIMTLGDGFDRREAAQDPSNHLGKIVRLNRDGSVPGDNPLAGRPGTAPEIFSLGHRNVQGVAVDQATGALLVSEHGPRGGDEINDVRAGLNYGWPLITGGRDYSFAQVTPFRALAGFEPPLLEWTPSIAPAGLAIYDGALFAGWRGDLLVPALVERAVRRVRREKGRITGQELLLAELGERIRDVRVARDGALLVLTDGPKGSLLRVVPTTPR
ncbi:glucose dehydrogenase [Bosea sp. AAP35]|nr:glucose dehydrogenase [Bosea sp. AAP35]